MALSPPRLVKKRSAVEIAASILDGECDESITPVAEAPTVIITPDQSRNWKPEPRCCWCNAPFIKEVIHHVPAWRCPSQACFDRCAKWMDVIDDTLFYLPLPKQALLYEAVESRQYRKICWGGQVAGGKSRGLRQFSYRYSRKFPDFMTLLLRRTYNELESSHLIPANRDQKKLDAKYARNRLVFDNGSILRFGHCQEERDYEMYLSDEYDLIIFDQLESFLDRQFTEIGARTGRIQRVGWRGIVLAGENPGGPGSSYVDELFISKNRDRAKYPSYRPEDYLFIPAQLEDNPYVDEGYADFIADLPEAKREMYRFGRRDIFPDQFFQPFIHPHRVQSLDVPKDYPRIGGFHWGYFKPGIMLWAVVLPDGRLYIEHEEPFEERVAKSVAHYMTTISRSLGVTVTEIYGNTPSDVPDAEMGEDIFETLQRAGLTVYHSQHDPISGWERLRHWFETAEGQEPALIIDPSCTHLIKTVPQLIKAANNPEDVNEAGPTEAAKALRYLVMSRPTRNIVDAKPSGRDLSKVDARTRHDIEAYRAHDAREAEEETFARSDSGWPFGNASRLRD